MTEEGKAIEEKWLYWKIRLMNYVDDQLAANRDDYEQGHPEPWTLPTSEKHDGIEAGLLLVRHWIDAQDALIPEPPFDPHEFVRNSGATNLEVMKSGRILVRKPTPVPGSGEEGG